MHSSTLRGSDFDIRVDGKPVDHGTFFSGYTHLRRLGVFAPNGIDGAGAMNLIMAHVTAFYDCYRTASNDFFAYPDYFVFQCQDPPLNYAMFDIWPAHKCVTVGDTPGERLTAITDRGVNIMLVPEGTPREHEFERVQIASALRNIDTCYLYSDRGQVNQPQITISCAKEPFVQWGRNMFDSTGDQASQQRGVQWQAQFDSVDRIEQSYRKITRAEALSFL